MNERAAGFTLIELLVVIGIVSLLAVSLMGTITESVLAAQQAADEQQLRTHDQWLRHYERAHDGALPQHGGHEFVLATWTSGVIGHTEENFDRFFSPGPRDNDPEYRRLRHEIERGIDPWPDLRRTSQLDTHYVGRAKEHVRTARRGGDQALMATDNDDGIWTWPDGAVHVLLSSGNVRRYSYQDLDGRFGLGPFDENAPIPTHGPASPIPECRRLAR